MLLFNLVQIFPPSRVIWTFPLSEPGHMTPFSIGDSSKVVSVPYIKGPKPFLSISKPAKSGLIFSQLSPWLIERNTSCAPTYNVLELWGEINNGVFQLKRKSSFLLSTIVFLDPVFWSIRVICPNWELEYSHLLSSGSTKL